jgi:exodeoxyribonuclease V alpha subunit
VVIPLAAQHYPMLQRNLLYTGVTRGRRLVVIVGQRRAIGIAVRGAQSTRRWSKLREWLESPTPRACAPCSSSFGHGTHGGGTVSEQRQPVTAGASEYGLAWPVGYGDLQV